MRKIECSAASLDHYASHALLRHWRLRIALPLFMPDFGVWPCHRHILRIVMQQDRNRTNVIRADRSKSLTPAEVGELLGISVGAVYKRLHEGRIPHFRVGNKFYINRAAFDRWLKSLGVSCPPITRP